MQLTYYPYRNHGYVVLLVGFVTCVIGAVIPEEKMPSLLGRIKRETTTEDAIIKEGVSKQCKYFSDNQSCGALIEEEEGRALRGEFCTNDLKDSCCYLCANRKSCEISCNYIGEEVKMTHSRGIITEDMDEEINKCKERIERLADLFAEGKIGEQSYVTSTKAMEDKIERFTKIKEAKKQRAEATKKPSKQNSK